MSTSVLSSKEFSDKFSQLVNRIWEIQTRLCELEEFEKQWAQLFDELKKRIGNEVKVNILNSFIYRSFRWDKYHVLINDLLSILENETMNEHSACRQAGAHLQILSVEEYIDHDRKINFLYPPDFPRSDEDEARRTEEIKLSNATLNRSAYIEAIKNLYPELNSDFLVSESDATALKDRIVKIGAEIKQIRQVFAHRYHDIIYERNKVALQKLDLGLLRNTAAEFFKIVRSIGLIYHQASYSDMKNGHTGFIKDQIDLILFGSIQSIHVRFFEGGSQGEYFWQARERYYKSEKLLEVINTI